MSFKGAEIISIGNEVLAGHTINTNAAFISQKLRGIGLPVNWVTTIRDLRPDILFALKTAASRANVVLITGGLGPTPDDITKQAACAFFKVDMRFDETAFKAVSDFLTRRNIKVSETNREQALVPDCEYVFPNANGTAPCLGFEREQSLFFFMPGVPGEMKTFMVQDIIPFLSNRLQLPTVHTALLRTTGIPESHLYEKLRPVLKDKPGIEVAFLPRYIGVDMRFRLISNNVVDAKNLEELIAGVKLIAGRYIFSDQEIELEQVVGTLLSSRKRTLSVAESFTGGLIADLLTNIPGSSNYLTQGVVTYSNKSKTELLGVNETTLKKYGAVSAETVTEMVRGIQKEAATDCAIATTGIAGPEGATTTKPVGLCYVAARCGQEETIKEFHFGTERRINKMRGAVAGLEMLRRLLLKE